MLFKIISFLCIAVFTVNGQAAEYNGAFEGHVPFNRGFGLYTSSDGSFSLLGTRDYPVKDPESRAVVAGSIKGKFRKNEKGEYVADPLVMRFQYSHKEGEYCDVPISITIVFDEDENSFYMKDIRIPKDTPYFITPTKCLKLRESSYTDYSDPIPFYRH